MPDRSVNRHASTSACSRSVRKSADSSDAAPSADRPCASHPTRQQERPAPASVQRTRSATASPNSRRSPPSHPDPPTRPEPETPEPAPPVAPRPETQQRSPTAHASQEYRSGEHGSPDDRDS